jgi:class 3 adenylate cyclase
MPPSGEDPAAVTLPVAPEEHVRARRAQLAQVRQELLAPVSAILGYQEMLAEEASRLGRADLGEDLEKIRTTARRLFDLVDRLVEAGSASIAEPERDLHGIEAKLRHDLRTPLNAIMGYAELLREDLEAPGTADLVQDLDQLLHEAARLLETIDRIVVMSRGVVEGDADGSLHRVALNVIRSMRPAVDQTTHAPTRGRILIVDDNASNREVLCRRLERDGHHTAAASSGREALELLGRESFDIVLLDLMMPEINGYELLVRLKADPRTSDIPVLMISGLHETDSVIRCIEAGADDYLEKPVNPVLLRARLGACLERKRAQDRERRYLADLAAEKARSEALLHNILPDGIIGRLNQGEHFIADRVENAAILFCDIVGFTRFAASLPPSVLVGHLDRVFGGFDQLCHALGIEKIKTIGDAYMAAAGLPEPQTDHHAVMAQLALGMLDVVRDYNRSAGLAFQVRIGIHAGPVVAGIIGRRKFIYDVWGDTVNIASRLEAQGVPDRIQVSPAFRAALAHAYAFEERGTIELRGAGRMPVHLLLGRGDGRPD